MNKLLTIREHEVINISKARDINKKTISYEDRDLLFEITYLDKKKKKKFVFKNNGKDTIKASSIVGSISLKNGLTVEILPKFIDEELDEYSTKKYRNTLLQMIRVSNEKNFITSHSLSSKVSIGEMPLINYIIELFSVELLSKLREGIYSTYTKVKENASYIKGNILVSETIKTNLIDKSKVCTVYNKNTINNLLIKIFKSLTILLLKDNNLTYKTKQNLYEINSLLREVDLINLKVEYFSSFTFNRLNDKFELLFRQAAFIFNKYIPFSSNINATPFWSILFDMDYLFEKFIAYLLKKSNINIKEQEKIKCYSNDDFSINAKPDYILYVNNEIVNVADAKWKLINNDKPLYGLNSQNIWQLFSYMNLINKRNEINGYFIVPKNSPIIKDIIEFNPSDIECKNIYIISIDFSLDFNEIIKKYSFLIKNNKLLIHKNNTDEKNINNSVTKFNFYAFITELELLNKNRNLLKNLLKRTADDNNFKNILLLKNIQKVNSQVFKNFIKENLKREVLSLSNLSIEIIPDNIYKLRHLSNLYLNNNMIKVFPNNFFKLHKLEILDVSNNLIKEITTNIFELKYLKVLIVYGNINLKLDNNLLKIDTLEKLVIDEDIARNNILLIKKLIKKNISIIDKDKKSLTKYINDIRNEYQIKKPININENEITEYILEKNISDTEKINFFYNHYSKYGLKDEIQNIILSKSNNNLKNLFKKTLQDIVDYIDINFTKIPDSWIYGFIYTKNYNFYAVKKVIALNTTSPLVIEILSEEENEQKILYSILSNLNINKEDMSYVVSLQVLDKILFYIIEQKNIRLAISFLKRKEISLVQVKKIITNIQTIQLVNLIKEVNYRDKSIHTWINIHFDNIDINIHNYSLFSIDEKINFVIEAKFNYYNPDLIKMLSYEKVSDLLIEILADKHNTLPLRFILLIYILNFKNINLKHIFLSDAIHKKDNYLKRIIQLSENSSIYNVVTFIESNFNNINKEILLGYAMSNTKEVYHVREKIAELTNDLEILDELSKNKDDENILNKIIFHTNNNFEFNEQLKTNNKYFSIILHRISTYNEYYRFEDPTCLIAKLSQNFWLSAKTRYSLFEKYNNDSVILRCLYNKSLHNQIELKKLKHLIEVKLGYTYDERILTNRINFETITNQGEKT